MREVPAFHGDSVHFDLDGWQIPDCLEREVVLTQLARDGGESSADRVYEFVVRERRSPVGLSSRSRDKTEFKRLQEAGVEQEFGIVPFFTACGPGGRLEESGSALDFSIRAPTTAKNLHRVLRALQVRGPCLSPQELMAESRVMTRG